MEMKKVFLKSTLLLGSVFVLAACGGDDTATESTTEETSSVVESVSEETVEETVEEETTEEESVEEETSEEESVEEETSEEESVEEETSEEESVEEETSEEESVEEETSEEESVEEETSEEESVEEETSEEESVEEETSEEESVEESTEALVDGEYTAVSNEDENGWSVLHVITVEDGEITVSDFNYVNAEGDLKSEDEEYNTMMEEKSGVSAADAMVQLNEALVEAQSAEVDVVSGATGTSETFVKSTKALLAAAAEGNTDEINIDELSELQDGEYTLTTEADERGWAHQFTIVVEGGVITESKYDMVDADGNLKSEDEEYNTNMEEGSGTSFATAVEELNAALVEKQSLEGIEVVSGASSTSDSFLKYAELLLAAAAEGNTDPIEAELAE
ncbi:FMN-binding protein [Aerococcaceae bacterium WS4759]|uniref:FMN-binding protein n=1 Tax=Fundicoccus ignavus TaxID=2664442 RepID=A0A6I2GYL4_9LACT|nr:FMN-binding protein [Fundicoccus ignavus]MRI85513.1 FMN-binding protein [Fundicoccus ignavus]